MFPKQMIQNFLWPFEDLYLAFFHPSKLNLEQKAIHQEEKVFGLG